MVAAARKQGDERGDGSSEVRCVCEMGGLERSE
jgi:hypothetical protein